jgi:hypothetical protein
MGREGYSNSQVFSLRLRQFHLLIPYRDNFLEKNEGTLQKAEVYSATQFNSIFTKQHATPTHVTPTPPPCCISLKLDKTPDAPPIETDAATP